MNEQQILALWNADKLLYKAWAERIGQEIENQLELSIAPTAIGYFLKVPMVPRLKGDSSLVDKALHRNKSYGDPYGDITDKIGMRYVVLLTTHIKKICAVIESSQSSNFWSWSKDRNYEEERLVRPLEFSYQSVHYILRSKAGLTFKDIEIPEGIACEIQIRTLLQHAHSELTHDTLYKPKTTAKPSVRRTVAKSMALIEATDEFFEQAIENFDNTSKPQQVLLEYLSDAYKTGTGVQPECERSNQLVVDAYMDILSDAHLSEIADFLKSKSYIFDRIIAQNSSKHFFKQPVALLAYFLADTMPAQTKANWPIETTDLAQVFSDLGRSYD